MKPKTLAAATAASSALLLPIVAGPAMADTVIAESVPAAATTSTVPAAQVVGLTRVPAGLTVTGHRGRPVSVATKGERTRTVKPTSASAPAKFAKLTPGKRYTVRIGGTAVGTIVAVAAPGATSTMTVRTGTDPGSVLMTWWYTARAGSGPVTFTVTGTPVPGQADSTVVSMQVPGSAREALLSGLNPHTLYRFSVEAINDAGPGAPATAVMTRSLADITGADAAAQAAAEAAAQESARKAAAAAAAAEAAQQAAQPQASGGGSGAPATKTIWECPTGFSDNGANCKTTRTYTFSTETKAYTYHWGVVGSHQETRTGECNYLPNPSSPTGLDIYCNTWQVTVDDYGNVKDATPEGYTDTGSTWTRQVKDPAPNGFVDDGSAWVKYADKVAREVPA